MARCACKLIIHLPGQGAAPGPASPALPTGGSCSPLRTSRPRAGAHTICSAYGAPGSGFFASTGSAAARFNPLGAVARQPTPQERRSLGLAGRGVRRPQHAHSGASAPSLCACSYRAGCTTPTSRGVCPAAPSRARQAGAVGCYVWPGRPHILWPPLWGRCVGSLSHTRSGRASFAPGTCW